MYVRISIPL